MSLIYAISFWHFISVDLFHPLHMTSQSYAFWSGIAGSFVLGGGIWVGSATLLRRHNCHVKGCMRIGRLPVAGTHYVVCNKHHPEGARTVEHIHQQYHRAKNEATDKRVLQANYGNYRVRAGAASRVSDANHPNMAGLDDLRQP